MTFMWRTRDVQAPPITSKEVWLYTPWKLFSNKMSQEEPPNEPVDGAPDERGEAENAPVSHLLEENVVIKFSI